jgi:hypothetical protein
VSRSSCAVAVQHPTPAAPCCTRVQNVQPPQLADLAQAAAAAAAAHVCDVWPAQSNRRATAGQCPRLCSMCSLWSAATDLVSAAAAAPAAAVPHLVCDVWPVQRWVLFVLHQIVGMVVTVEQLVALRQEQRQCGSGQPRVYNTFYTIPHITQYTKMQSC